jgi:biopolymer transport protein ExbD
MSWQVRHEGSPNATTGLTAHQVVEGLTEGVWDPSAEVKGPGEAKWTPLEQHPVFEEALSNYESPPKPAHDDTHLDMNPLIDVALVLLIFFILTTSYDAMRRIMDMPAMSAKGQKGEVRVQDAKAPDLIMVKASYKDGKVVVNVDGSDISEDGIKDGMLKVAFQKAVNEKRTKMVIDVKDVPWGTVVDIIDAGHGAYVQKFMMRIEKTQ